MLFFLKVVTIHFFLSSLMLSSENAPQLTNSFWNVGSPSTFVSDIDTSFLLREAKRGLALEVMRISSLAPPGAPRPPIRPEDRIKMAVELSNAHKTIEKVLKAFDRSALTSQQPWQVPNDPHSRAIAKTFDGTPMQRSLSFEFAKQTLRSSFNVILEDPFNNHMHNNFRGLIESIGNIHERAELYTYGEALGAVELAVQCMVQFTNGTNITKQLLRLVKPHLYISFENPFIADIAEAEVAIEKWVDQELSACDLLLKRAEAIEKAHELFSSLKQLMNKHVAERRKKPPLILFMEDDCLDIVSRHLDEKSAISMIRSCKTFQKFKPFSLRIPHMHIRMVPGKFPHMVSSSLDRDALKANLKQLVTRNFVVKKKNVFLYVDFVQQTLRQTPLKKKPRGDGLDNLPHDFSDDEFEEGPDSPYLGRPTVGDHNQNTDYGARMHKLETKRQLEWDNAEGPREKVDRWMYNRRIPQERYFENPLEISVSLVFADTMQPANSPDFPDGINPSNRYIANGSKFRKPHKLYEHEMPAQCKLHVPLLTSDYGGRRFRLKLIGKTTKRGTSRPVSMVTYSEPFEVVSDLGTIGRATKRKTAAEASNFAREREIKKSRAAAMARSAAMNTESPQRPATEAR